MKFTVFLTARVPVFSEMEIEADTQAEAFAKLAALVAGSGDDGDPLAALKWQYGENMHVQIGALDERDLSEIEAQDALPKAS